MKAMGESVTKRMNDMDKKLEELTSRIQDMEVEVCSMLSSTSLVESTSSPSALTAHTAVDQPSGEAGPLSSTQLSDERGVTEISVDIQSPLLLSRTGPSQDAVLTTITYDESITDQPSEEAGPLSFHSAVRRGRCHRGLCGHSESAWFLGSSEMADCMQAQSGPVARGSGTRTNSQTEALHIVEVQ